MDKEAQKALLFSSMIICTIIIPLGYIVYQLLPSVVGLILFLGGGFTISALLGFEDKYKLSEVDYIACKNTYLVIFRMGILVIGLLSLLGGYFWSIFFSGSLIQSVIAFCLGGFSAVVVINIWE